MSQAGPDGAASWADAVLAARLLAIDGPGLGGVRLRARAGPVRDRWLALLRALFPGRPMPRLPLHAEADRLVGGLDLAATLRAGRPVGERGVLHRADGGVLLVAMAERLEPGAAAAIGSTLDTGRVEGAVARSAPAASRFAVVALDEGAEPDEATPAGLADRLALHVDLGAVTLGDLQDLRVDPAVEAGVAERLASVSIGHDDIETLCAASLALGITSLRATWLAVRAARAAAVLERRDAVNEADIAVAARLVLAPRATTLPAADDAGGDTDDASGDDPAQSPEAADPEPQPPEQPSPGPDADPPPNDASDSPSGNADADIERVLDAVRANVPAGLLEASLEARASRGLQGTSGKAGALEQAGVRGRPAGVRRGRPGPNARLNLVETLRAAAPWQKLRGAGADPTAAGPAVRVRQDDFRVTRFKTRTETTTVFVVDASGSAALHRLAEAKGAVELLLADCYVRRDQVALISFRGTGADVLLPPTRSLVQAKRRLAELPGGGGTPLAAGLERAFELGLGIVRRGATPVIVALTDGRANIGVDGKPGREQAHRDALEAGYRLRTAGLTVLLVDTSPRPRPLGRELAAAMGARYIPLPRADAENLSAAVRAQTG